MGRIVDRRRRRLGWALIASIAVATSAACATDDDPLTRERAERLVDAAEEAGVADRLTVETAMALYGADAAAFCEVHRDGIDDVDGLVVIGNLAQGRRTTITDQAVEFGRLLAETYCPDVLADFEATVADFDPFEVGGR